MIWLTWRQFRAQAVTAIAALAAFAVLLAVTGPHLASLYAASGSPTACMSYALTGSPAWLHCLTSHGIRIAVTYQPVSRYWAIQWTETAIYLALALALAGYCFWRLNRRLS